MMYPLRRGLQRGSRRGWLVLAQLIPLVLLTSALPAQDSNEIHPQPGTTAIFPSPAPFTLDARAAQTCIEILRIEPFLLVRRDREPLEIVRVREVYAWFAGFDESMPEGHRRRYDIHVNGRPLDWEHSYIEWGGEMVNMQLLFTYRNQYPPRGLDYRME